MQTSGGVHDFRAPLWVLIFFTTIDPSWGLIFLITIAHPECRVSRHGDVSAERPPPCHSEEAASTTLSVVLQPSLLTRAAANASLMTHATVEMHRQGSDVGVSLESLYSILVIKMKKCYPMNQSRGLGRYTRNIKHIAKNNNGIRTRGLVKEPHHLESIRLIWQKRATPIVARVPYLVYSSYPVRLWQRPIQDPYASPSK